MSGRTEQILPASSAQRQGAPRGDVPSKSWGVGHSLAAQTHVLAGRRMFYPLMRRLRLRHKASAWPPALAPR
jgi:hypothetical protein